MALPTEEHWKTLDGVVPEDTCECICGAVYRSHAKFAMLDTGPCIYPRKPCPACGKHELRKASSDPEIQRL